MHLFLAIVYEPRRHVPILALSENNGCHHLPKFLEEWGFLKRPLGYIDGVLCM